MKRLGVVGAAFFLLPLGCSGAAASKPPSPLISPPSSASPALAVPADLDVVVRIDLDPMRAVLQGAAVERLATAALGEATLGSAAEVVRLGLGRARQVWIGWRPGPHPRVWDNVMVLRGNFSDIREAELTRAFHPAKALPNGWRSYEVRVPGGRAAPARVYAHLEDLWVVASVAEIDAVERLLSGQAAERGLEPPERGVLSFAARLPSVARELRREAPKAGRFLAGGQKAEASADLTAEGLDVSAEMQFFEQEAAERAAAACSLLIQALALGGLEWLSGVQVQTVASTVVVRARVPSRVLSGSEPEGAQGLL